MIVGMVTAAPFPPDIRVEKEAEALVGSGHQVVVYVLGRSKGRFRRGHVEVEHIPAIMPWTDTAAPLLMKSGRRRGVEVIHAQDTPGALAAAITAKLLGIPLIFDVHDFWDELMLEVEALPRLYRRLSSLWYGSVEEVVSRCSDHVLTIVDEAATYLASKHNLPSNKVASVMNVEDPDRLPVVAPKRPQDTKRMFLATYVGGLDIPSRNLHVIPKAASVLKQTSVRFLMVGDGPMRRDLESTCVELGVQDMVRFTGRVPFADAIAYIAGSDVCLLPYKKTIMTDKGLSHKVSQYLALGKPVVSSPLTPVVRMFGEAILQWNPQTPERMAELLLALQSDAALRARLASNGFRLVREKYNWKFEARKLTNIYESLSSR